MQNKKKTAYIIPVLLALVSTFSLSVNTIFSDKASFKQMLLQELNGIGLANTIILIALTVLFIRTWDLFLRLSKWITHLLAFVFSSFMMIGLSYSKLGNWDFLFGNKRQFIIAFIVFAGYFVFFDILVTFIFSFFSIQFNHQRKEFKTFPAFIKNYYQLSSFLMISICWLPYLLFHLPGSVPYDGYRQINMYYGIEHISNHHPWVLTKFFGCLMDLGRNISDNFGIFLITLTLFLVEAFCYSIVCKKIKNWGAPLWFNIFAVLFFAILPVFGAYAQVVMKDGIFSALFALFFVYYVDLCREYIQHAESSEKDIIKKYCLLFLIELLVCLTRNNGIHMVLPANLLLFFFTIRGRKRYIVILLLSLLFSFYIVDNKMADVFDVDPGSKKEMLSIPFQQTARYLKEYPDDVEEWEKEAINKVLSFESLADKYEPEKSDKVKDTFRNSSGNRDLLEYFKAWGSMFMKHPGVYVEATLNNIYGYIYPFYNCNQLGSYQFYIQDAPLATGDFDIHYIIPKNIRELCDTYAEIWKKVPGIALMLNPGTYTWILLGVVGYFCYKKQFKGILVLVSPMLNILICFASPVNGYLRYAIPLIACIPVIFYWCIIFSKTKQLENMANHKGIKLKESKYEKERY